MKKPAPVWVKINTYVLVDHDDSGTFDGTDYMIVLTGVNLVTEIALADFL